MLVMGITGFAPIRVYSEVDIKDDLGPWVVLEINGTEIVVLPISPTTGEAVGPTKRVDRNDIKRVNNF